MNLSEDFRRDRMEEGSQYASPEEEMERTREQCASQEWRAELQRQLANTFQSVRPRAKPIEPREFGPLCFCCGKRGLKRIAPHEYRCPRTNQTMRFSVRDGGYFAVPLRPNNGENHG